MITAAGIMFLTPGGRALFLKRGAGSDHPGEWAFPGGQTENGETPEETAVREAREEAGKKWPDGRRTLWVRTIAPAEGAVPAAPAGGGEPSALLGGEPAPAPSVDVDYSTFLQRVPDEFEVTLCDESTGYAWADVGNPPEPLHPGCRLALDRLTMDEQGVARAIAEGRLTSPQTYENIDLFAMRVTGTGLSYRPGRDEHVWRDSSLYLNDEFLTRCSGLPVILEHPKKGAALDSEEFAERIVGIIMFAYIKGDEVWGIAKVYDDATKEMLRTKRLSTSPSVVFRDPATMSKFRQEDGSTLLIEGKPSLLDHLAICPVGVWDKGGPAAGIISDSAGDRPVADEKDDKKEDREDARKDGMEALNDAAGQLLGLCDSMGKRMDAMEEREKARDDAMTARMDAWDAERKDARKDSEDDKDKDDKRDDARKDGEDDDKKEDRKDSEDKDDDKREDRKDARKDADDDKDDKRDDSRNDAWVAPVANVERQLRDLDRRTRPLSDEDRAKLADAQARADSVFSAFGGAAPRAMDGEDLGAYRRRLAGDIKNRVPKFKDIDLVGIKDDAAFTYLEGQIYNDALEAAHSPSNVEPGMLIGFTKKQGGHEITTFRGAPRDWMDEMAHPGGQARAVGKFLQ